MQFGINQNCYCLASTDAVNKQIDSTKIEGFVKERDGEIHIKRQVPSSVPLLGYTVKAMKRGEMAQAMFGADASLFLKRMCQLSDSPSFLLEANPKTNQTPTA